MTEPKYSCPTCGHPIRPTDPFSCLSPTQRALFDAIDNAGQRGLDSEAIRERLFGYTKSGASNGLISTHIANINARIRMFGLRITATRHGKYGSIYTLRRIDSHANLGEDHGSSKLSGAEVEKIRQDARPTGRLAVVYNVSRRTIERIKAGKTWRHIA